MICGNCKDRDQTVAHVRDCYAGKTIQAAVKDGTFAAPTPPKPDEPQGLGAVVQGRMGLWVRVDTEGGCWQRKISNNLTEVRKWDGVGAIRVLSEGWKGLT